MHIGCDGGEDFRVYQWIMKVGGIPTDESYGGYLGQDGYCHVHEANVTLVAPITGEQKIARHPIHSHEYVTRSRS